MRRVVLGLAVSAAVAIPASTAQAMEDIPWPPVNCGIVSCTYPVERKLDEVNQTVAQEQADLQECIQNTFGAIRNILQGTPQPAVCDL